MQQQVYGKCAQEVRRIIPIVMLTSFVFERSCFRNEIEKMMSPILRHADRKED
jgi:hypothetical protein